MNFRDGTHIKNINYKKNI